MGGVEAYCQHVTVNKTTDIQGDNCVVNIDSLIKINEFRWSGIIIMTVAEEDLV